MGKIISLVPVMGMVILGSLLHIYNTQNQEAKL